MRQRVLKGEDIDHVIWGMIGDAIDDAVDKYITQDYVAAVVAEWARVNFEVTIDPDDIRGLRGIDDLESYIKNQARAEAETNIGATLGEFTGEDPENRDEWDLRGLSSWAMSRFQVNLSQAQIRRMNARDLEDKLRAAAIEQIDRRECAPLMKYLQPLYAEKELAAWAYDKFGIEVQPEEMLAERGQQRKSAEDISELIETRARAAYANRELEYPIDHAMTYAFGGFEGGGDNPYAADYLRAWTRAKFGTDLPLDHIRTQPMARLREELVGYQRQYYRDGKLEAEVDAMIQAHPSTKDLAAAVNQRFSLNVTEAELQACPREDSPSGDGQAPTLRQMLLARGRQFFRRELTDLEQFVLIQIFDQTWKDHLYAMDILKAGIGLQAFAERDPRIAYKKEGYRYFQEMMASIRDKVTDLIFRARVVGAAQARSAYNVTAATHQDAGGYGVGENAQAIGSGEMQKAAGEVQGEAAKARTIVREAPKVGRNDPCPCGSGKKYKKCCGVNAD